MWLMARKNLSFCMSLKDNQKVRAKQVEESIKFMEISQ
jgi:hypothetical protein